LLKKLTTLTSVLLLVGVLGLGSTALPYGAWGAGQIQRRETISEGPAPQARSEDAPKKDAKDNKVLDKLQGVGADDKGKEAKRGAKRPAPNQKVQALLKERLPILKEVQNRADKRYQTGQGSKGELLQTTLRVLKAQLDLCATDMERIAVHENMVAVLMAIEQQAEELAKRRAADVGTLLEARLNRLEAEIALERARTKSVAPSK
jgi:hypothetical protein